MRISKLLGPEGGLFLFFCIFFCLAVPGTAWCQIAKADSPKAVGNEMPPAFAAANYTVDGFRNYTMVAGLKGTIHCTGSDSFDKVLPIWAAAFRRMYPGVEVKGTFKESPDAITALLKSTAQIGLMSRSILASEVKELADGFGYKPSWIPVLVNAVAIIVNKSNPISGLSLKQLDAIYSKSLKRGASSTYEKWGELGVEGELGKQRLEVYSRASNTTDHKFFLEEALLNGEMRPEVRECSSSADLVKRVAHNAAAIGFCGLDAISDDVRTLPLGTKDAEFFTPQESNIRSGAYPISRQFVMVFNRKPGQDTDPLTYEFLRFVLSMEGQAVVVEKGCFPISHEDMRKAFRIID